MKLFLSVSSPFSSKFLMFDYWWLLSLTIRQFHFSLSFFFSFFFFIKNSFFLAQEIFERFLLETDSPGVAVAKTFKELLSCSEGIFSIKFSPFFLLKYYFLAFIYSLL